MEATGNQEPRVPTGQVGYLSPVLGPGRGTKNREEADDIEGSSHGVSLNCANQPEVGYRLPLPGSREK